MFIKSINWIDENAQEAEVIISDNVFELSCFSHPFLKLVGDEVISPLYCFGVENIVLSEVQLPYIEKGLDYYSYVIRGRLHNKAEGIICVNNLKLCIKDAYLPQDIAKDDYVEFNVSRIDLF